MRHLIAGAVFFTTAVIISACLSKKESPRSETHQTPITPFSRHPVLAPESN